MSTYFNTLQTDIILSSTHQQVLILVHRSPIPPFSSFLLFVPLIVAADKEGTIRVERDKAEIGRNFRPIE